MIYSLIAALCAVTLEYLYRVMPGTWWEWAWFYMLFSLTISFCIYKLITVPGQPLVGALIMWSFAVIGLRVFVSAVVLRDHIAPGTWAAVGLLIVARVAQVVWK